ncbi:MAG: PRC-barrel domain-containing protein [Acidimicrobiales bacterium]
MRLSELLNKEVIDANGQSAGHVHDVRVIQDGPITSSFDAALRVHGLIVGRGALANRLGYGRSAVRGPWVIRAVLEAGDKPTVVPWHRVRVIEATRILITGSCDDLERARPVSDGRGAARE